jgi:hypothetical protein
MMQSRLRNATRSVRSIVLSEIQTLHGRCCLFGECLVQSEPIERTLGREKAFLSACQDGAFPPQSRAELPQAMTRSFENGEQ